MFKFLYVSKNTCLIFNEVLLMKFSSSVNKLFQQKYFKCVLNTKQKQSKMHNCLWPEMYFDFRSVGIFKYCTLTVKIVMFVIYLLSFLYFRVLMFYFLSFYSHHYISKGLLVLTLKHVFSLYLLLNHEILIYYYI